MRRKIAASLIAIIMIFSITALAVPVTAKADSSENGFMYTIAEDKATVTGYSGSGGAVTIPDTLGGKPVVVVGNKAFQNQTSITSVSIPASVWLLYSYAFDGCTGLTSVTFRTKADGTRSLTDIYGCAFSGCTSLESITIPATLTYLMNAVFQGCEKLSNVTFEPGCVLTYIYESDFYGCKSLKSIALPPSIATINNDAFECSGLESITLPKTISQVKDDAFQGCPNLTRVNVLNKDMVFSGDNIFVNTNLNSTTDNGIYGYAGSTAATYASTHALSGAVKIQFHPSVMVTFDSKGGSDVPYQFIQKGTSATQPTSPTKKDSLFMGWYNNPTLSGNKWDFTGTVSADTAFYAKWIPSTLKVTFNAGDGAAVSPASKTVAYGSTYGDLPAPVKAGYGFGGWYTGAGGTGTQVKNTDTVSITSDITLYAKWQQSYYTVNFNAGDGGTVNPTSKAVTYGSAYGDMPVPAKKGYDFVGWYTGVGGTGGQVKSTDTVCITSDITLYAKWQLMNAYLSDPGITGGALTKTFAYNKYSYKVNMADYQDTVTFTPAAEDGNASVWVNGVLISSSKPGVSFNVGYNGSKTVKIKVKYNNITKVYTFAVHRVKCAYNLLKTLDAYSGGAEIPFTAQNAPGTKVTFDPKVNNYYVRVGEGSGKVTIKTGVDIANHETVSPKSALYSLQYGQNKTVAIKVKSQSGKTNIYYIHIIRAASSNADIKSLTISLPKSCMSPAFDKNTLSYTVTVPAAKTGVKINVKAAGYKASAVITNTTSGSSASKGIMTVNLTPGGTSNLEIAVKAQDGTIKKYKVTVTRASS